MLARDALRVVLRRGDRRREHGLPGEHHFFTPSVTADDAEAVAADFGAIIGRDDDHLQHQFWELVVTEDRFEVGLSFGGIPERLVVPFAAIKSFLDPSVQFGLQFEPSEAVAEAPAAKLPAVPAPSALPVAAPEPAAESKDEPAKTSEGAEVVRLDRFRKK